jgi:hypothetical protein
MSISQVLRQYIAAWERGLPARFSRRRDACAPRELAVNLRNRHIAPWREYGTLSPVVTSYIHRLLPAHGYPFQAGSVVSVVASAGLHSPTSSVTSVHRTLGDCGTKACGFASIFVTKVCRAGDVLPGRRGSPRAVYIIFSRLWNVGALFSASASQDTDRLCASHCRRSDTMVHHL